MNEFQIGQALTANQLNQLKRISDGQNLPSDGEFIKSTGVNMWKSMNANNPKIINSKAFDLQVRFLPVGEGENFKMVGFWFVKIGSGVFVGDQNSADNQLYSWDCCLDNGYPLRNSTDVARVMSVQIGSDGVRRGTINFLPFIKNLTDEIKTLDYTKYTECQDQNINGDGAGWYNTGVSIDFEDNTNASGGILYACLVGVSDHTTQSCVSSQQSLVDNTRKAVLVFSNAPLCGLKGLNDSQQQFPNDYSGESILPLEMLGQSVCLAYAFRRDYTDEETQKTQHVYDVHYTDDIPDITYADSSENCVLHERVSITHESETEDLLTYGHSFEIPYIIYNNQRMPVYIEGGEGGEDKSINRLTVEYTDEFDLIEHPMYVGCYVKIDLDHEEDAPESQNSQEQQKVKVPRAYIEMRQDMDSAIPIDVGEAVASTPVNATSFLVQKRYIPDQDSNNNSSQEEPHKCEYIPLFYFYVNVVQDGDKKHRRILYTHYFQKGIPTLNNEINSTPEPFDISSDGKSVINCVIQCGNKVVECDSYTIDDSKQWIYLHIDRVESDNESTYQITVDQEYDDDTDSSMTVVLYEYENKTVKLDRRPKIIPVFAL